MTAILGQKKLAIEVDPLEFEEWISRVERDDLLHAFRAIKCIELIQFRATIGEDFADVLAEWGNLK